MRVIQPAGTRGSLLWIQRAVAERWPDFESPIINRLLPGETIDWRSPLELDDFAEYRDGSFLDRLDLSRLSRALDMFWPRRGPQWDALGISQRGSVLLVEAKAHVAEFCTPPSAASDASLKRIQASLIQVATALGSTNGDLWHRTFYQYANRLAHLWFLYDQGIDARLVLVGFVGDRIMKGPSSAESWQAAYALADHVLGLPVRHPMRPYIIHCCPEVRP